MSVVSSPGDSLSICEHCDSVYRRQPLRPTENAFCARCGALLERGRRLSTNQMLALTVTAGLLFLLANLFPLMTIRMQGLSSEATLWGTVEALARGEITLIALVAGLSIVLAPGLQILLLGWVLAHAQFGRIAPGFRLCMRSLEHLRPWSMLEVCLLGIAVATIKLAGMLEVHPGVGLWSLVMLTVLILVLSGRDIRGLWDELQVPTQ